MDDRLQSKLIDFLKAHNDQSVIDSVLTAPTPSAQITIPTLDEFLNLLPDSDLRKLVNTDSGSDEFNIDGTYRGKRPDGCAGRFWGGGVYLQNPDGTFITRAELEIIAGTIYEEASMNGHPHTDAYFNAGTDGVQLKKEIMGMFDVFCNRAKAKEQKKLVDIVTAKNQFSGYDKKYLKKLEADKKSGKKSTFYLDNIPYDDRARRVMEGILCAARNDDITGGAFFWDGVDIRWNKHFTEWAIHYIHDEHDIYETGNSITKLVDDDLKSYIYAQDKDGNIIGCKRPEIKNKAATGRFHIARDIQNTWSRQRNRYFHP